MQRMSMLIAAAALLFPAIRVAAGEPPTAPAGASLAEVDVDPGAGVGASAERGRVIRRPGVRQEDNVGAGRESTAGRSGRGTPGSIVAMLGPLLAVLVTIALVTIGVRRYLPRVARLGGDGAITVLSRFALSGRQTLCLVRVGRRVMLLGVTPERIGLLTEISDPIEAAGLAVSPAGGRLGVFSQTLNKYLAEKPGSEADESGRESAAESPGAALPPRRMSQAKDGVAELVERLKGLDVARKSERAA